MTNIEDLQRRQEAALNAFNDQTRLINSELAAAGVMPATVIEYQNKFANEDAIRIFAAHLDDPIEGRVKAVMASSMGSIQAEYLFDDFSRRLRMEVASDPNSRYAIALANALSRMVSSKETLLKLHDLIWDRSLGPVRIIFLQNFKSLKDSVGLDVLAELAKDPDLNREIRSWKAFWKKRRPEVLDIQPEV